MAVKVQNVEPEDETFIAGPFTTTIRHASPGFWGAALRISLQRFEDGQQELLRQRKTSFRRAPDRGVAVAHRESADCHFILIAMRNVLRVLEDRVAATDDPRLLRAESDFRAAHPDVWHLRDVLEHLLDYEAGKGRLQQRGEISKDESQPWLHYESATDPDAEVTLHFASSGRSCQIKAAARTGIEIADLLVTIEHSELFEGDSEG